MRLRLSTEPTGGELIAVIVPPSMEQNARDFARAVSLHDDAPTVGARCAVIVTPFMTDNEEAVYITAPYKAPGR